MTDIQIYVVGLALFIIAMALTGVWILRSGKGDNPPSIQTIQLARMDRDSVDHRYVESLTDAIEDISKKAKSIKDDEERARWLEYVQELRVRQLKVIQTLQDREFRETQTPGAVRVVSEGYWARNPDSPELTEAAKRVADFMKRG